MVKNKGIFKIILLSSIGIVFHACTPNKNVQENTVQDEHTASVTQLSYFNVKTYPHNPKAFTEGLFFNGEALIESTGKPDGQKEDSKIIKYDLNKNTFAETGITLQPPIFGEGSILINGKIYWLTYKEGTCYVYDESSQKLLKTFKYQGEGWGMTTDGKSLIMSDGSNVIKFINPENFDIEKTLNVTYQGISLSQINELELVDNYIYANIFEQKIIVKINIQSGEVEGILDLTPIVNGELQLNPNIDVLNGIAYHKGRQTFFVTGKYWSNIYEIGIK